MKQKSKGMVLISVAVSLTLAAFALMYSWTDGIIFFCTMAICKLLAAIYFDGAGE